MKAIRLKIYLSVIFVALMVMVLLPSSFRVVHANEPSLEIETYYPDNVVDYTNLHGISEISATQNDIAYTLDKNNLIIFEKNTRSYTEITGFNNIKDLKYISDNTLLVVDNNYVRIVRNTGTTNANALERITDINLEGLDAIDIYNDQDYIYIGLIRNSVFELYKYGTNLQASQTNPVKQTSNAIFDTAYNVAISDNNAYVLFKNSENKQRICSLNYNGESTLTPEEIIDNVQLIDCFYHNNEEYIVAFTKETLHLFKTSDNNYKVSTTLFNNLEISDVMDIDCYNNIIYTSDSKYETIQTYEIITTNNTTELKTVDVLLCSFGSQPGRFNDIKNIHTQGDTIYVSDNKNNRAQIITENNILVIDDLETDSYPRGITTDTYNNVYFVKNRPSKSILVKYSPSSTGYTKTNEYSTIDSVDLGLVSDTTITNANIIYLLDYTNDKLVYLTQSGLQEKTNLLSSGINLDENSRIEYIKSLDLLVILNNNTLHLLDTEGVRIHTMNYNATEITSDLNAVITLYNNQISLINITNDQFSTPITNTNEAFENFSTINYDILNRRMYAFDSEKQAIKYFDISLQENPLQIVDYNEITTMPLAFTVKYNANIYDYPYGIGNSYTGIHECIGIENYNNEYYRVIFNHNNTFTTGYLKTYEVEQVPFDYTNCIRVITTNKQVPIYKYPTILRANNSIVTNGTLSINKSILISQNHFPVSIDGKKFYLYTRNNNTYGFIFNADVVLDDNKTITYLNVENAQIKSISNEPVTVYDDNLTTPLLTLKDGDRIYVESYDKNQEYTKIIYKDKNLNSIEGYVKTNNVKMDKLDNTKIILIVIIVISIILLGVIITSYIIIKKKK